MPNKENRFKKEAGLFDSPVINPENSFSKKKTLKKWDEKMTKRFIALETICPEIKYFAADFESWARDNFEPDSEEYSSAVKLSKKLSKTEALLYNIVSMMTDMSKTGEISPKEAKAFETTFTKLAQDAGFNFNKPEDQEDQINLVAEKESNDSETEEKENKDESSEEKSETEEKAEDKTEDNKEETQEENPFESKDPEDTKDSDKEESDSSNKNLDYQMSYDIQSGENGSINWTATITGTGYSTPEEAEDDLNHIFKNAIDRMDLEEEMEEAEELGTEGLEEEASAYHQDEKPADSQEIAHQEKFPEKPSPMHETLHPTQDVAQENAIGVKPHWMDKTFHEATEDQLLALEAAFEDEGIFALLSSKTKTMKIHGSEQEINSIINKVLGE